MFMRGREYFLAGFVVVFLAAIFNSAHSEDSYATYDNERFSYSLSYPSDLFIAQGEASNADGQEYRSKDGKASMRTFGTHFDSKSKRVADLYYEAVRNVAQNKGISKVTYKSVKKDWFVISGYDNADIFYQKTIVRYDVMKTLTIRYSKSAAGIYDAITKKISQSFKG